MTNENRAKKTLKVLMTRVASFDEVIVVERELDEAEARGRKAGLEEAQRFAKAVLTIWSERMTGTPRRSES